MAARIIGYRWMLQIHNHGPGCAEETLSFRLRYGLDGFGQLSLVHYASGLAGLWPGGRGGRKRKRPACGRGGGVGEKKIRRHRRAAK